jgi:tryptophan-rich sensory protein
VIASRLKAFGAFWYDFVVGDDWRVAVGVVAALVITAAVSQTTHATWWIVPLAVVVLLPYSLWRVAGRALGPP